MGSYVPKAFDCPAAKGLSSVRAPQNISYLQQGLRVFTLPFPGFIDPNAEITKYTEYWFNDSEAWEGVPNPPPRGNNYDGSFSGVSNRKIRMVKNFDRVVLVTDALDEFPRHTGRASRRNANTADNSSLSIGGQNNFLFGDMSVKSIDYATYQGKRDRYKSTAQFYNWGHFYGDAPSSVDDGQTWPF